MATIDTLIASTLRELSDRFNAIDLAISDAIGQACIREQGSRSASGCVIAPSVAREGFTCSAPTVVTSLPSEQGITGITTLSDVCDALVAELDSQADSDARADYVLRGSWIR